MNKISISINTQNVNVYINADADQVTDIIGNTHVPQEPCAPFEEHKRKSLHIQHMLVDHYRTTGEIAKAARIDQCGSWLLFKAYTDPEKTTMLDSANFCRHPLCPMCAWRLSLKWSVNLYKAALSLNEKGFHLYHLILTQPSVSTLSTSDIKKLRSAARTMYTQLPLTVVARAETIEITVTKAGYHPHIHCLIASPDMYIHSKDKLAALRQTWGEIIASPYGYGICALYPVTATEKSVAEVCKYVMSPKTHALTVEQVATVATALHGVRKYITDKPMQAAVREARALTTAERRNIERALAAYDFAYIGYSWRFGHYAQI